jgi:trehalose 2-sulfotransferase
MPSIGRGYLVASTQRSGSTLLCELLKATGVAGRPEEYFQRSRVTGLPDQPREYFAGVEDPAVLALLPPLDPGTPEREFDFRAVRRAGTTPNGVFGAKLMWSHMGDLRCRLRGRALEDVFGELRYIQVVRRDKVAQAVSLWTAIQTQSWRDGDAAHTEPVYSSAAIRHLVGRLTEQERAFTTWLEDRDTIRIVYEEFAQAPAETVADLLGVAVSEPAMRRQSGGRSQEWIARYTTERSVAA